MKHLFLFGAAICCASVAAAPCVADIPGFGHTPAPIPGSPRYVNPANAIPIVIEAADIEEPTLEIPRKMLQRAEKVAANTPAASHFAGWPVPVGGALALCFTGGAVFVPGIRRKALCLGGLLLVGCLLFVMRGVPVAAQPPAAAIAKPIALPTELDGGKVHITVTDDGETARLRLPRKKLPELAKQLKD
jgi:hypothetical protein